MKKSNNLILFMVFICCSLMAVNLNAQNCAPFNTAPVDLNKSFDPVDGVQDRVQLKWYKASPEIAYTDNNAAMCDIKFWAKRTLDPCTGDAVGPVIVNPDTILIKDAKKTYPNGSPRSIFKWPVKFRANGVNNNKRAEANTRYEWQVRCECGHSGNGPESPWSDVKIFNTPDFDETTGIYTPPPTTIYLPDVSGPAIVQASCLPAPVDYTAACNQACAQQVIDNDPFCLTNSWDGICQGAYALCNGDGIYLPDEGFGGPAVIVEGCPPPANYSLACSQACAQQVIDNDPFCLSTSWDGLCQEAYSLCNGGGIFLPDAPGSGPAVIVPDCGTAPADYTRACSQSCAQQVIDEDPFCLSNTFDGICQEAYSLCNGGGIFLPDAPGGGPAVIVPDCGSAPIDYTRACSQFCAQLTINDDPFCLENTWDGICEASYNECMGAGIWLPDTVAGGVAIILGDCETFPSGYSYACNQSCAQQTIDDDSFCTGNNWDGICQSDYNDCSGNGIYLPNAVGGGPAIIVSDCNFPADYTKAADQACAQQVIDNDPFCITTNWDSACQSAYDTCTGAVANEDDSNDSKVVDLGTIDLRLYPNPSDGTFINLEFSGASAQPYIVQVTDMTGRLIHTEQINPDKNLVYPIAFQNGNLSSGMYMLNLFQEDRSFSSRFTVK